MWGRREVCFSHVRCEMSAGHPSRDRCQVHNWMLELRGEVWEGDENLTATGVQMREVTDRNEKLLLPSNIQKVMGKSRPTHEEQ